MQFNHTALDMAIDEEGDAHTHGDAEKHHQGIQQSCGAGNIVFGCQVSDSIGERYTRDERNDGTDHDVAQMSKAKVVSQDTKHRDQSTSKNVSSYFREVRGTEKQNETPKQDA